MSRRIVWVVSNDCCGGIPEGVLGVYAKKADAVRHAIEFMREGADGKYNRTENRHGTLGVAVNWFEPSEPLGVAVDPFEVQP